MTVMSKRQMRRQRRADRAAARQYLRMLKEANRARWFYYAEWQRALVRIEALQKELKEARASRELRWGSIGGGLILLPVDPHRK